MAQLLEFNAYEYSRFDGSDVNRAGRFGYRYRDLYWTEADRYPFLIVAEGQLAGLALIREGSPHSVAEFLVLPKYRRRGIGRAAARELFARFAGDWEVREAAGNDEAVLFWRRAIPVEFTETSDHTGVTQRFVI